MIQDEAARLRPAGPCCGSRQHAAGGHPSRRARLHELTSHIHCSVIGTCLGTASLRKLLARHVPIDCQHATDLEIHHTAVGLAAQPGPVSKALHKLLDEQHAAAVRRFAPARDATAIEGLWRQALQQGDVPGAYWALLTHADATPALRQAAFGDVHMLSHLVGAANRADIQRLVALERENEALREKADRQQARLREISIERDQTVRQLNTQLTGLVAQRQPYAAPEAATLRVELYVLRQALHAKEQQVALHSSRRDQAEQALVAVRTELHEKEQQLERAHALQEQLRAEVRALELAYLQSANPARDAAPDLTAALQGRRLVYVGGRPGSNAALRELVGAAGGEIVIHDGGIEDRKGLLSAALQRADLALFPVDCVDHDSVATLKRLCGKLGTAYQPLRTASVSSFLAAMLAGDGPSPPKLVSRFCLRHG